MMTGNSSGLVFAISYGAVSLFMVFLNKFLITTFDFDYPLVLILTQHVLTLTLLEVCRITNILSLGGFDPKRALGVLPATLFYSLHSFLSLRALSHMNIPMYGTVKRCTPLVSLAIAPYILQKASPSRRIVVAVSTLTFGAILAAYTDLSFDLYYVAAYRDAVLSVFSQALYLTLVERLGKDTPVLDLLYYNCFFGVLILLAADAFVYHQFYDAVVFLYLSSSLGLWLWWLLTLLGGVLLNYLLFACTTTSSALTTSIVGNIKAIAQTVFGFIFSLTFFMDMTLSFLNITGIVINVLGCVLYSHTKLTEKSAPVNQNSK